ncbi:hypothetical protein NQ314_012033 [Rhamnusium bicolor]|uniref:Uncharacterized protein n=1 Tax=Rhamnusium bicolor TaxID=1586634 RepID=A0AAV8XEX1_9CUCU|nr:hypothetical protein NQ314_012033 [Rhamnusium bicolor]
MPVESETSNTACGSDAICPAHAGYMGFLDDTYDTTCLHQRPKDILEQILQKSQGYPKGIKKKSGWQGHPGSGKEMGLMISNPLAAKYSWLGRRQKVAFKEFALAKLIIEVALTVKSVQKKEVEVIISNWLRRAKDRMKKPE